MGVVVDKLAEDDIFFFGVRNGRRGSRGAVVRHDVFRFEYGVESKGFQGVDAVESIVARAYN